MIDFFISYAREDSEFASEVATRLIDNGWTVWIDERDIPASVPWMAEIEHAIGQSMVFLALSSSDWRDSSACTIEADLASRAGLEIVEIDPEAVLAKDAAHTAIVALRALPDWKHVALVLSTAARTWDAGKRRPSLLARGVVLRAFRRVQRQYSAHLPELSRPFVRASNARQLRRVTLTLIAALVVPLMVLTLSVAGVLVSTFDERAEENIATAQRLASASITRAWNPYLGAGFTTTDADTSYLSYLAAFDTLSEVLPDTWTPKAPSQSAPAPTVVPSPDGSRVATIAGSFVEVGSAAGGAPKKFLVSSAASSAAWSADGRWIAVGAGSGVDIVSSSTGSTFRLRGIVGDVLSVAWSDSAHVTAVTTAGEARWPVFTTSAVTTIATGVRYGRLVDGALATVDSAGELTIADLASGGEVVHIAGPDGYQPSSLDAKGSVIALAYVGDGDSAVMRVVDSATHAVRDIDLEGCVPTGMSIAPDLSNVFLSCNSATVTMARVSLDEFSVTTAFASFFFTGVIALEDSVLWGSSSGGAWQTSWNLEEPQYAFLAGCGVPVRGFAASASGAVFPVGDGTGTAACAMRADYQDNAWAMHRIIGSPDDGHAAPGVALSPNGGLVAYGYSDGNIRVFTTKNFYPVLAATVASGQARVVSFVDEDTVLVAGEDGVVVTIDVLFPSEEAAQTGVLDALTTRLQHAVDLGLWNPEILDYEG